MTKTTIRIAPRIPVSLPALVELNEIKVVNISQSGLGIMCAEGAVKVNQELDLKLWLGETRQIDLKVIPVWQNKGKCGLKILESTDAWNQFVSSSTV